MCTDFSTISEAYSQDCERRSMRSSASVVMPRMPQWMSEKRLPKMTFRIAGRHRRAEVAVQRRHRPRLDVAAEARAHDELGAAAELLDERRQLAEVVGAVAVAHERRSGRG